MSTVGAEPPHPGPLDPGPLDPGALDPGPLDHPTEIDLLTEQVETVELVVGRVGRPHGLRGQVVLDVRTDEPARRFTPGARFETSRGMLELESTRWHGARLLATFVQAPDRAAAELLRGIELRVVVPAAERPADPDEYYDHQLRGLAAHVDGARIGIVTDVLHLPGQDVLVVQIDGREVLVPFVADIVSVVDLVDGHVEVVDRPGLLAGGAEAEPRT